MCTKNKAVSICVEECCIGGADDRLSEVKVVLLFGYWGEHVVPE